MTSSSASDSKRFIDANQLQALSEKLAVQIAESGEPPFDFLIALWRGGCGPGAVVQEVLQYIQKCSIDHVAIRTVSRDANGNPLPEIEVHAIGHAKSVLKASTRLLICDDVFDSGRTIAALIKKLEEELGDRMPRVVKVATVFYKPKRNKTKRVPDYYVEETDQWLVFPHELEELSDAEIKAKSPFVWRAAQAIWAKN